MAFDLPDYHVVEKLGIGANSEIYSVEHVKTRELRAAKYVKLTTEDEKKYIEQLKAEQATGKLIDHPVLRKIYDLILIRKNLRVRAAVLMMEYVDGVSMSASEFRPTIPQLLSYFRHVAEALGAMHRSGFVHADLKPGNILITPEDRVKLIDFGQSSAMLQAKDRIQGTIDYMAPEQASRSVLDQRTDVFGFGATLYRVLTGQAITTEMNKTAGLHSLSRIGRRRDDFNRPIAEDIPTCVLRMIEDCCREAPVDRIADMRSVVNRIDLTITILEHQSASGRSGSGDEGEDAGRRLPTEKK